MYLFQVSYLVTYFLEVLETPLRLGHRIRADYDGGGHQRSVTFSRARGCQNGKATVDCVDCTNALRKLLRVNTLF